MSKIVIGVMGGGQSAPAEDVAAARVVGAHIAHMGYVTMTGGRDVGVMAAALAGAKQAGGETLAISPYETEEKISKDADIVVSTNMYSGRNYINALTSDVMVAFGPDAGTLSEIAFAIRSHVPVVLCSQDELTRAFLKRMGREGLIFCDELDTIPDLISQALKWRAAEKKVGN